MGQATGHEIRYLPGFGAGIIIELEAVKKPIALLQQRQAIGVPLLNERHGYVVAAFQYALGHPLLAYCHRL